MEVRVKKYRSRALCYVSFTLVFNTTEQAKINKFGAPSIELGGTFDSFTLPLLQKKLSEFPYSKSFDGDELGHTVAEDRADEYTVEIKKRLQDVWTAFKAILDDYDEETVYTL